MNLAGPELLIVAAIVAVIAVVVLVVSGPLASRSKQATQDSKSFTLPERGDVWLARIATSLSGLPAHRVEWAEATTLEVYWTRRPVWTFVAAIFFFPLGLLALLATTTMIGTFQVVANGPPANVRATGDFSKVAVDLVNRAIPD